jgi:ubiquinone/menaquinone biosynthesis C-methylase UbiE
MTSYRNDEVRNIGDVGKHLPAMSSALRPDPLLELDRWGGKRLVRGKRVLDLGCGDGRFALGVAPLASSVEGLDPDEDTIVAARESARKSGLGNVRFAVGAAQRLPYPDAVFDVVLLSWTL